MRNYSEFKECTKVSENRKIEKPYFGLLLIVTLVFPTHAFAHCYKYWHYNFPQHCGRGETGRHMGLKIPQRYAMRVQVSPPAPVPEDKSWSVEITKVPGEDDSDLREVGIEKLREQLK